MADEQVSASFAIFARMTELNARSADGTIISAESYGRGQPLVIISGALFARERWLSMVPLLASERDPIVVDRRGRGRSGNTLPYAPEREIEDVLAVLDAIQGPVDLLGHSSGAILALQAANRVPPNLARLLVYEPPVFFDAADSIEHDLPERLDALLAAGDNAAAVATFLREGPRVPEREIEGIQASQFWPQLLAGFAHTVPYDSRIQRSFHASAEELDRISVPTLCITGSASPERMQAGARTVASRLAQAQIAELAGQEHVAQLSAPALFAATVNGFLSSTPQ